MTLDIEHLDITASYWSIAAGDVDFGEAGVALHHFFGSIVLAEDLGMHKHSARSRLIEPAEVEDGFRFAGTEEMPLAVSPCFDPGVIVVGVGPAWGIDLAGRYADAAQGCYEEGGFLAATSVGRTDGGEGR